MPRVLQASQRRAAGVAQKRAERRAESSRIRPFLLQPIAFRAKRLTDKHQPEREKAARGRLSWCNRLIAKRAEPCVYRRSATLGQQADSLNNPQSSISTRIASTSRCPCAYRCRTRSLISWVRPWFQNWVPMYPQVRRATLSFSWSRLPHFGHSHTSLPSSSTIWISPS